MLWKDQHHMQHERNESINVQYGMWRSVLCQISIANQQNQQN